MQVIELPAEECEAVAAKVVCMTATLRMSPGSAAPPAPHSAGWLDFAAAAVQAVGTLCRGLTVAADPSTASQQAVQHFTVAAPKWVHVGGPGATVVPLELTVQRASPLCGVLLPQAGGEPLPLGTPPGAVFQFDSVQLMPVEGGPMWCRVRNLPRLGPDSLPLVQRALEQRGFQVLSLAPAGLATTADEARQMICLSDAANLQCIPPPDGRKAAARGRLEQLSFAVRLPGGRTYTLGFSRLPNMPAVPFRAAGAAWGAGGAEPAVQAGTEPDPPASESAGGGGSSSSGGRRRCRCRVPLTTACRACSYCGGG